MNAILTIRPYRHNSTWVFDDPAAGLVREPFVAGIPEMIDRMVASIPGADRGFRLLFSAGPFPGASVSLEWLREEIGGNWYRWPDGNLEGWLCPALFKYFDKAPPRLYARVEPLNDEPSVTLRRDEIQQVLDLLEDGDIEAAKVAIRAVLDA